MEAKKFISTLKGYRTRFTNNPNAELEKKSVESLCEKMDGKLNAISILNENGQTELVEYTRKVLGLIKTKKSEPVEKQVAEDAKGNLYEIDTVKKTCKRLLKDFSELADAELEVSEMNMNTYARYLKDKFPGEGAQIKKGKLYFRGYRISCDIENGFMVEDSTKRYAVVETGFEGIPTPKELGEFFSRPRVEHTPEELAAAIERGKELARKAKEEAENNKEEAVEEVDFEKCRRAVLRTIKDIRSKTIDFDPTKFPEMIPFRRWKRNVNSLISKWKDRSIRYSKFLNELEKITTEETFVVKEKNHRSSFKGSIMPSFTEVGELVGNKLCVDGKQVDAVPFLLDYLLCEEPRAMAQIMKFASGDITEAQLLKNPLEQDWKIEYNKKALENTAHNAMIISMVFDAVGVTAPQDINYNSGLEVGDKIAMMLDGEFRIKTVTSLQNGGVFLGKSIGLLLKSDKWYKLPNKDEE